MALHSVLLEWQLDLGLQVLSGGCVEPNDLSPKANPYPKPTKARVVSPVIPKPETPSPSEATSPEA